MNNHPDYNPYDPEQSPVEPAKSVERIAAIDLYTAIIGTVLILAGVIAYLVITS